jgi:hypothetical protein
LAGEFLELLIAEDGFLDGWNLLAREITGNILPILPRLQIVIRTGGSFAQDTDFAAFHLLNLADLLEERFRRGFGVHAS